MTIQAMVDRLRPFVNRDRVLATAERLVARPSPTGRAIEALDELEAILKEDGFQVSRPDAGHSTAPAVVCRLQGTQPGPTLQFNGHLDTVHLPFAPPSRDGGLLRGSGSCDMKGGTAAAVEALRALRDADALRAGAVLLTAHDLHEAPWGFGEQLDRLIDQGIRGDAVLIPEPLSDHLPVAGRGHACWKATVGRSEPPVHEVMRPPGLPDVLGATAGLVGVIGSLHESLSGEVHPTAGRSSAFVGMVHSGEIFNQSPREGFLEGTRRWVPDQDAEAVEASFRSMVDQYAARTGTMIDLRYQLIRHAFHLDLSHPIVSAFEQASAAVMGRPLPRGPKPFVDDGNSFWGRAGVPAITHGPRAAGQHTTAEWVEIDDMVRVAWLYAATAVLYCGEGALR